MSKTQETYVLTKFNEEKTDRQGRSTVKVEKMKIELSEAEATHMTDREIHVEGSCDTPDPEWEERQRVRTEEWVTGHDAIKLLNDDDENCSR